MARIYWTSQFVQLNVGSRLCFLAIACFVLAKRINSNGEIHLKQFDFEVQEIDKRVLCAPQLQAKYTDCLTR